MLQHRAAGGTGERSGQQAGRKEGPVRRHLDAVNGWSRRSRGSCRSWSSTWSFVAVPPRRDGYLPGADELRQKSRGRRWVKGAPGSPEDVTSQLKTKDELKEIIDFLHTGALYRSSATCIPRACFGGSSRTEARRCSPARWPARPACRSFRSAAQEFVEMFVGVGAAPSSRSLRTGQRKAPASSLSTTLDAIGRAHAGVAGPVAAHEEREQTLNQLLTEMDGFDTSGGVIIMARPTAGDSRSGAAARAASIGAWWSIGRRWKTAWDLQVHARKVVLAKISTCKTIAALTAGLVGADLANLVNEAALLAAVGAARRRDQGLKGPGASSPVWSGSRVDCQCARSGWSRTTSAAIAAGDAAAGERSGKEDQHRAARHQGRWGYAATTDRRRRPLSDDARRALRSDSRAA